jgi:hypothetical protein
MTMIRNRIFLKSLALFFIVEIFSTAIAPAVSHALTSGPTSPEHTTFEPFDITDMVNVPTGDFVYNMPLFEVPGPAGGYPISMSYHAGIQTDLDASWTGLGWTLNPGAINRSVDGSPDDYNGSGTSERTFWEGGKSVSASAAVGFGNSGITAGLVYASDTYRGMSVASYLSAGGGTVGLTYSADAYGNTKWKPSATYESAMMSGAKAQFQQLEGMHNTVSGGMSSIKSAAKSYAKSNIGIDGYRGYFDRQRGKEGGIRTKGWEFNVVIPIQTVTISLAAKYKRYWIDEKKNSNLFGSLYLPTVKPPVADIKSNNYDVTDLSYLEPVPTEGGPVLGGEQQLSPNPSAGLAGTYLTYDNYNVTGQGIAGSIRPYHFNAYVYRPTQSNSDNRVLVEPYPLGANSKPSFRFINDFSNSFQYDQDDFQLNGGTTPLGFAFDNTKISTGDGSGIDGYVGGVLAGSKTIKYYTQSELNSTGTIDILKPAALGLTSTVDGAATPADAVAGFKVINESGMTYHYALPVYSYDEYSYSGSQDWKGKHLFNLYKRLTPYAYTWLLTTMTGPDYVDANGDGKASPGDYGYWVNFEYGKWTDVYHWRNPAERFSKDFDHRKNFFSKGKKEVYYLNAIRTASHTALFVKELRRDGKGVVHDFEEAAKISNQTLQALDEGGFNPITYGTNDTRHPVSTLRLKEIILLKNEDVNNTIEVLAARGSKYNQGLGVNTFHLGANVIDVHDIQDLRASYLLKSVRSVSFDHDYGLATGTINSFISDIDKLNAAADHLTASENGKLRLKSIQIIGKGGVATMPAVKFNYDITSPRLLDDGLISYSGIDHDLDEGEKKKFHIFFNDYDVSSHLDEGDIAKIWIGSTVYYALVLSQSGNVATLHAIDVVPAENQHITAVQKTKNPPYKNNFFDNWGFYKADYVDYGHENISRYTSVAGSKAVDAWSLHQIQTITGATVNIDYESDSYENSIKKISSVVVKDVEVHNVQSDRIKVTLFDNNARKIFKPNDPVVLHGIFRQLWNVSGQSEPCDCGGDVRKFYDWRYRHATTSPYGPPKVVEVGDDYIIMEHAGVMGELTSNVRSGFFRCEDLQEQAAGNGGGFKMYISNGPYEFTGGELQFTTNAGVQSIGGGLRVKQIYVANPFMNKRTAITYEYSQGVTSYEPLGMDVNISRAANDIQNCVREKEDEVINEYFNNFVLQVKYKNYLHLFANSRLMPGPGVMYGSVKVRESVTQPTETFNQPTYTVYGFEVFNPKIVDVYNKVLTTTTEYSDKGYKVVSPYGNPGTPRGEYTGTVQSRTVDRIKTATASVQDFSAVIGTLKSVTTYNNDNQKISEVSHRYLFDEMSSFNFPDYRKDLEKFTSQGLIEEVFADAKLVHREDDKYELLGLLSKFSQFPSIEVSTTSTNYKTGITQTTENVAFDFYSGQITQTLRQDGYGNYYLDETTPAYRQYPEMGLAISGGKNMLIQEAAKSTFKSTVSFSTPIGSTEPVRTIKRAGLVNAQVATWSNKIPSIGIGFGSTTLLGVWRKQANYSYAGERGALLRPDGTYNLTLMDDFTAWNDSEVEIDGWRKNSEVKWYDVYSHTLEEKDLNGNYSCRLMTPDRSKVLATVVNSPYNGSAYSGAEEKDVSGFIGGNVMKADGAEATRTSSTDKITAHTGQKAYKLTTVGKKAFRFFMQSEPDRAYRASVWMNSKLGKLSCSVNGVLKTPAVPLDTKKAGNWYLVNLDIPAESASAVIEVWCEATGTCNFDDFRVHPVDASMTSYVYDAWGDVSHVIDNNNLYTEYKSDAMGNLLEVHRESFLYEKVKLSEQKYYYANQ